MENNKKNDGEYQLTEKGKELAKKISQNNIEKDKLQQSVVKELAESPMLQSTKLKKDREELDRKIAEAKKLEDDKQKEVKKTSGMSYQKAEKIRNKSFGTLLAEQEGGLGESFKKALKLKTQARAKGIKEKFDPMNIAKFLTMGSNWAPAMLGKITGRNKEDMARFTGGKVTQMGGNDTATRIDNLQENDDMVGILSKILSFMQKTNDDETKRREETGNYAEEIKSEKDKRFQELLKALKALGLIEGTATKEESEPDGSNGPGIFPALGLGAVTLLSSFIALGGAALSYFAAGTLATPGADSFRKNLQDNSMLGAASGDTALAAGILDANQGQTPEQIKARQEEKKAALADTGMATKIYGIGETEALKKKGYTQEQIDALRGDTEKKKQVTDEKQQAKLVESFDKKGGDLTKATMEELEAKKAQQIDYGYAKGDLVKSINAEIQNRKQKSATDAPSATAAPSAAASVPSGGGNAGASGAGASGGESSGGSSATPAPSSGSSSGQKLSSAMSENLDAKLSSNIEEGGSSVTVNNANKRVTEKTPVSSKLPLVRNQESTFRQMIYNNTRVV